MESLKASSLNKPLRPGLFYGWVVVGISFTSLLIRFGVLQTFSVFLVALVKEFGWNRGDISGAQSLVMVMIGVGGPLVGYFMQKWGPRKVISLSALFLGLMLALTSQVKQIWQFYLLWGLLAGLGHSFQSIVPWTAVISNWFVRKRGVAMGTAMAGIGIGYFLIVPLTQYIISTFSWQVAMVSIGGILAIGIAPITAIFIRESPEKMGLMTDGDAVRIKPTPEKQDKSIITPPDDTWTVKKALKTSSFWLICFSFGAILFTTNIILAHQVAFMVDVGYKAGYAAFIFGVFGITSLPFRVVWGFFSDRAGPIMTYTISTLLLLGGIFALLSISSPTQAWLPFIFALLWGSSYGTTIIIVAVVSANLFQGKSFGVIFGFVTLIGQILGSPGAWLGGYIFDVTKSYSLAFLVALLCGALSCALMWAVEIRNRKKAVVVAGA